MFTTLPLQYRAYMLPITTYGLRQLIQAVHRVGASNGYVGGDGGDIYVKWKVVQKVLNESESENQFHCVVVILELVVWWWCLWFLMRLFTEDINTSRWFCVCVCVCVYSCGVCVMCIRVGGAKENGLIKLISSTSRVENESKSKREEQEEVETHKSALGRVGA